LCSAEKPWLRYNLKVFLKPGGQAPRLQDTAFAHPLTHAVRAAPLRHDGCCPSALAGFPRQANGMLTAGSRGRETCSDSVFRQYPSRAYHRQIAGQSHRVSYMADTPPTEYFIQGITSNGRKFRPSDWSERLAGVMSCYGPGARGPNARLQYSHYVRPTLLGDLKCVILDSRLRDIEPMAFDFVMNFAKDNDLLVTEACELPPEHEARKGPAG
jgi:hypothetical protein